MELLLICGAMESGKTYRIKEEIGQARMFGKSCVAFDHPKNTRNTDRDLHERVLSGVENISQYDLVCFDECHMYDVFGNASDLLKTIYSAGHKTRVICSGIYYDFYDDYRPFPLWLTLRSLGGQLNILPSRTPCAKCGSMQNVYYSANDGSSEDRVGNHYINVCASCKDSFLVRK